MWKNASKPRILITSGDPAGIGPEIIAKALAGDSLRKKAEIFVIGEVAAFTRYWDPKQIRLCDSPADYRWQQLNLVPVNEVTAELVPGQPSTETARSSLKALEMALDLIVRDQSIALVTGPMYKKGVQNIGFNFPGHTEYLGDKFNCRVLMMFWGRKMRVATLTTHYPIREVADRIDADGLRNAITVAAAALQDLFRIKKPKIAVLGLNPHAGEEGKLGDEDVKVIIPVCDEMRAKGINLTGPLPADVAFFHAMKGEYDMVLGMYHDQVLAPFKMLYFDEGVNLTLGLPFIRTSPDHGTAFDIAGKGIAAENSMRNAIHLAFEILRERAIHEH